MHGLWFPAALAAIGIFAFVRAWRGERSARKPELSTWTGTRPYAVEPPPPKRPGILARLRLGKAARR